MRWLRKLHLYAGLVIGAVLFILAVTGGALIFKEEIWRLQYPELAAPLASSTPEAHAAAFQRIAALVPRPVRMIKTPQQGIAAYHVYFDGGEAFVDQTSGQLIARWTWYETPIGILTELHIRLAAGNIGKTVAGVTALVAALMAASGIVLWWPLRHTFSLRHLVPQGTRRLHLLQLHRDLGTLTSPLLLLFTLTAAGIVFYPTTQRVLNELFSGDVTPEAPPFLASDLSIAAPSESAVREAQRALPHANLMSYYPPSEGSGLHYFRFKEPDEIHPNGRSVVYVDHARDAVVHAQSATEQPLGERLAHALFPIHAARLDSPAYTIVGLLAAVALSVISLVGPLSWMRGRQRRSSSAAKPRRG